MKHSKKPKEIGRRYKKMNKKILLIILFVFFFINYSFSEILKNNEAHEKYLYPIVRVTVGQTGGSGTIIYSKNNNKKTSTYILTNHHVIDDAIKIEDLWDSNLRKNIKVENRNIVYVEIFKYKDMGTPIGTMKLESDIIIYNNKEDMGLLKLRLTEPIKYIASLPKEDEVNDYNLFDETIAVGCSLGFPPISTPGIVTRKNFQIDSFPYHMSTSQIIYGNSGGAVFLASGKLIGIPSLIPIAGWGSPITHMGLFIPIERIYKWLKKEGFDFIFDINKDEETSLKAREERIKKERKEFD